MALAEPVAEGDGTGSPSKAQRAYRWIKDRIASAEYTPGYRLVLSSIAAEAGMSVVPVREAIRQLEAEGLVTFERNVGARVAMQDQEQYSAAMVTLGILEGAATALAAPFLRKKDLAHASALNNKLERCLEDFDPHTFTQVNHEFHQVLFSRCPNRRLRELVDSEWERMGHLRDSTFAFVPGRARESVAEHRALVELIARGAPGQEIEASARGHRNNTLTSYLKSQKS